MAGMQQAHRLQAWPTVLEYSANLTEVWRRQGLYSLARQGYRWSLDAAQAVMDSGKEAEIQLNWGRACLEQSDYQPAQAHFEAARRLFTELEDTAGLAAVYYHLSHLLMEQDNHQAAEETIQQAWQGYQLTDDVGGMGRALYRLGNIVYHRGDYARCVRLTADAIRIQAETEDHLGLLRSHMLATSAQVQLKNIHAAEAHCQIAASLVAPLNDLAETAIYYYTYADVLRKKQAFPAALEYGQKALTLFRDMGDSNNEVNALLLLAGNEVNWNDAEPERQEVQEGFAYCQAALDLCETIGYRVGKAFLLLMKGRLLVQAGNKEEACITYVQALTLSRELNHQWLQQRLVELIHENCSVPSLQ
jgi:tetratricopeptide (TPR) repeat protein